MYTFDIKQKNLPVCIFLKIPQFLGNVKCQSQPCSVIVSPYIPGEVAITMETGNLYLWNGDKIIEKYSPTTVSNAKCCICEYGGHPRQVVQGNETNIKLIDFRVRYSCDKFPFPYIVTHPLVQLF